MNVSLSLMRETLLPELSQVQNRYAAIPGQWDAIFYGDRIVIDDPLLTPATPALGLGTLVAIGAAAAIIQNQSVSRRGLFGWFK